MKTIDEVVAELGPEPINRAMKLFGDALIETGILLHPISAREIQAALSRQIALEASSTHQDSRAVVRVLRIVRRNLTETQVGQTSKHPLK